MRKILCLLFTSYCSIAFAQTEPAVKLPQVLPPAPEAAAIIKAGQLSVGLHTGAAQASVPVHTLTAGGLSFPVSLNYASNGFKVDAIPSRVGMDWSMSLGVVSRNVLGIPDEKAGSISVPSNLYADNQAVLDFYESISSGGNYEAQPDEFNYSAPGISGKFIINRNDWSAVHIQHTLDKVQIVRNVTAQEITQIIITAANGNRYFFGGNNATEHTVSHNVQGGLLLKQNVKTAFFLYRVEDPYGNYIDFNYLPINTVSKTGVSMSVSNSTGAVDGNPCNFSAPSCPGFGIGMGDIHVAANQVEYETVYISSISGSSGGLVSFSYQNRPDLSGDKRITAISAYQDGRLLKTVTFTYTDPASYSGNGSCFDISVAQVNKRFFLSGISMESNDLQLPPLNYTFSYNDITALPYRLSYGQDHFGFYNGKSNSTLLPALSSYTYWFGSYGSADRSPDGAFSVKGMLTQIQYPTGGTESFEYEPNTILSGGNNVDAGGVRVKNTKSYDPVTQKEIARYYKYATLAAPTVSTGIAPLTGQYVTNTYSSQWCEFNASVKPLKCGKITLLSNSTSSLYYFAGNHIGYTCITESDDPNYEHGATEHYFITDIQGTLSTAVRGNLLYSAPNATAVSMNGIENRTRMVNKNMQTVKEVEQTYSLDSRVNTSYYGVIGVKKWDYANVDPDKYNSFDITLYQYAAGWPHLDKTTVKEYDPATGQMMQTVTDYYYDQLHHLQPNRVVTTSSENETLITEKKFASDLTGETYPSGQHPWQAMVGANILDPVIEERVFRNPSATNVPIAYTRNEMVRFLDGVKPTYMNLQKGTNSVETRIRYHKYSTEGQVLEMSKENDTRISFIWDYKHQLPVAEATNASWNDIAYTSFEADGTGNWSVPGSSTGGGFTGVKAYNLSQGSISNNEIDPAKDLTYLVQCWVDNPANILVNGAAGTLLMTKGSWKLLEFRLVDPASITISGTALVDELRLFPDKAQIKTLTYLNGVGTLTVNDPRSNVTFYEYDGFNRLIRIRDIDKNIVKQMEYKYGQSIVPCPNTAANWVATGTTRCQKDATNCNTGNREHEERDMNNCSSTYWTTRWISDGASSNCTACTTANCSGPDKKCVNCVCETGTKIYISSVYNRSTGMYTCTYYYLWSDNSQSQNYTEQSATSCPVGF